jgi:hypothetical protein
VVVQTQNEHIFSNLLRSKQAQFQASVTSTFLDLVDSSEEQKAQ